MTVKPNLKSTNNGHFLASDNTDAILQRYVQVFHKLDLKKYFARVNIQGNKGISFTSNKITKF